MSPLHLRYLALNLLLLRVKCLKACYLCALQTRYATQLIVLYAQWSKPLLHLRYLLLKRFIIHKLKINGKK